MIKNLNTFNQYSHYTPRNTSVAFCGIEKNANKFVKDVNLGLLKEGLVGDITIKNSKNEDILAQLFKSSKNIFEGEEHYILEKDKEIIGEIYFGLKKHRDNAYIYIADVNNYKSKYVKAREDSYGQVALRLTQLAQKRGEELGIKQIHLLPYDINSIKCFKNLGFEHSNPLESYFTDDMYLPAYNFDALKEKHGGLSIKIKS